MFSMFKKKGNAVKAELKKVENRDLMEAIVAGSLLIAAADGEIEDSELKRMEALIAANPNLKHYGSEINETISRFMSMFEAGPRMGKMKAMRELDDIKASPEEKEEAFVMMIEIAEADGEIEPEEQKILAEIAQKFGMRLADYGLA